MRIWHSVCYMYPCFERNGRKKNEVLLETREKESCKRYILKFLGKLLTDCIYHLIKFQIRCCSNFSVNRSFASERVVLVSSSLPFIVEICIIYESARLHSRFKCFICSFSVYTEERCLWSLETISWLDQWYCTGEGLYSESELSHTSEASKSYNWDVYLSGLLAETDIDLKVEKVKRIHGENSRMFGRLRVMASLLLQVALDVCLWRWFFFPGFSGKCGSRYISVVIWWHWWAVGWICCWFQLF